MIAHHRQTDILDHAFFAVDAFADHDIKDGVADIGADINRTHIGLRRKAKGENATIRDAPDKSLDLGVVDAQNGKTIKRDVLNEILEGLAQLIEIFPVIQMFRVDVGHD